MTNFRLQMIGFSLLFALANTGCQHILPYELQPHQLWKLNRGPALGRDTYNFYIPDPELTDQQTTESSQTQSPIH